MSIWRERPTLEYLNEHLKGSMAEHVGIRITEIGDDYMKGSMPVDHRTCQYMGIAHGGANVVLAETLGSFAANLCCQPGHHSLGLEINANHVGAGRPPEVHGIARPLHIGRSTMVWEIKIYDHTEEKLVCVSRHTVAVLESKK